MLCVCYFCADILQQINKYGNYSGMNDHAQHYVQPQYQAWQYIFYLLQPINDRC